VLAMSTLSQLDSAGIEQLKVSRVATDVIGSKTDYSQDLKFSEAMAKKVYYGPVYFFLPEPKPGQETTSTSALYDPFACNVTVGLFDEIRSSTGGPPTLRPEGCYLAIKFSLDRIWRGVFPNRRWNACVNELAS